MANWFYEQTSPIKVTKDIYDDPALFIRGKGTTDIKAKTTGDFPMLTQVTVKAGQPVYAFLEPMSIWQFDPSYKGKDLDNGKIKHVRFIGRDTGWIYMFVGLEPSVLLFEQSIVERSGAQAPKGGEIGITTDTTLGIIIRNEYYNIIDPLLLHIPKDTPLFEGMNETSATTNLLKVDVSSDGLINKMSLSYLAFEPTVYQESFTSLTYAPIGEPILPGQSTIITQAKVSGQITNTATQLPPQNEDPANSQV